MESKDYNFLTQVKPALCLDLDGTIRFNAKDPSGFINGPDDVAVFDDVEPVVREWKSKGYLICGVTNQGGVAYGHKTIEDVHKENIATLSHFEDNLFDAVLNAPSMKGGSVKRYSYRSFLRKPEIGMLALLEAKCAENDIVVDWDNSVMVGNSSGDQDFARRARIEFRWAKDFFGREKV